MNDIWFEKIEKYFNGEMNEEEKRLFELEVASDKELQYTFNTYQTMETAMIKRQKYGAEIDALKNTLDASYTSYNTAANEKESTPARLIFLRSGVFKTVAAVAACFLVVVVGYFVFFNKSHNPHQIADTYIKRNLTEISQSMSSSQDLFQQAIASYNLKHYNKALTLFNSAYESDTTNRDAKEYSGYIYLVTNQYEKALQQFDELDKMKGRFNKGLFLKALTLLHRSKESDILMAKQILQSIIKNNTDVSDEARKLLKGLSI